MQAKHASEQGDFDLLCGQRGDAAQAAAHPALRPISEARTPAASTSASASAGHALPRVRRAGRSPVRVLLVADARAIGGRRLAERIADDLARHTGRGLTIDIVAVDAAGCDLPAHDRMSVYDAVVAVFGRDTPAATRRLAKARAKNAGTPYVDVTERLAESSTTVVEDRAALVVDAVAPLVRAPTPGESRVIAVDEAARQYAVNQLAFDRIAADDRLHELVRVARLCYGASHAELNVIDGDRHHTLVSSGESPAMRPLEDSICARTLAMAEPLVLAGPQHFVHPLSGGDEIVSFYAGVQLESPDGHRIGTVCVYDSIEAEASASNMAALTLVAAQIEQRLFEIGAAAAAASSSPAA